MAYLFCEQCGKHWEGEERICPNPDCREWHDIRDTMPPEEAEKQGLK